MVDIKTNLLKNRKTLSEKDFQKERDYLRYSVIGLLGVVVVVIGIAVWNFVLTSRLSGIERSLTEANTQMQGLSQASAKQLYLLSRLKLVTNFLSGRSINREAMQRVLSTDIEGTHVAGVSIEDENALGVSYVSNSRDNLASLLTYYEKDTDFFPQVVSKGISRSKDGTYQVSLILTLPNVEAK